MEWLSAVYCADDRPAGMQRDVLTALCVRYSEWRTGLARVSQLTLMAWCQASRSTVQRALRWARSAGMLDCVSRGHRLGDGTAAPSVWRLHLKASEVTP